MSELLDKLNREFEYLREEDRNEETGKYLIELVKIVENNEGEVDSNRIRNLLNKMIKIISSGVLIPLTLNEGEFKYIKPGLSVNRRNANIIMDNYGIYYNRCSLSSDGGSDLFRQCKIKKAHRKKAENKLRKAP